MSIESGIQSRERRESFRVTIPADGQRRHGQAIGVEDEQAGGVLDKFLEPVSESRDAGMGVFTACRGLDILNFFDFLSGAMRLCDGPNALPESAA